MKTFSRRIAALLLVVTVGITALAPAASASSIQLPSLPKDQCVVDDAGVLSDSTTSELETLNAQLSSSCDGAQIGVLTVDYTGSATTEDYATEAFNTWDRQFQQEQRRTHPAGDAVGPVRRRRLLSDLR